MAGKKIPSPGACGALLTLAAFILWWTLVHHGAHPTGKAAENGEPSDPKAVVSPVIRPSVSLANTDIREPRAGAAEAAKLRDAAAEALKNRIPGVRIDFDEITGGPAHIMATSRFLTAPAAGVNQPVKAEEIVAHFIDENHALFGHDSTALRSGRSRITRDDTSAHNGMHTLVWQQELDGIPFFQTVLRANLTKNGELIGLGGNYLGDPAAATGLDEKGRAALIAEPPVAATRAIVLAAADVDTRVDEGAVAAAGQPRGSERSQEFTAPAISDTRAGLAWVAMGRDSARLAWDVTLMSLQRGEMFRVLVDSEDGKVLVRQSLTNYISNATYRVYAKGASKQPHDSPTPMSPGHATALTTQPPEVSRELITLTALNTTASPNGWINDGVTETLGNNVDAHTDFDASPNSPDLPRPTSATRNFDFNIDFASAPSVYKDAAVTQLFYLNNWVHDKLYELGFTESAGNFQTNNFSRGGLGNDAVLADAQDGSGTNNANFSTPADGSPGRMQMYVFTGPTPDIDGDLDAEIVIHEYVHGLSNRLVGGGTGISANQSQGMGEGWSDFYGLSLLSEAADDINGNYAAGGYATRQFSSLTQNYYFGIRRYPYSTNLLKNPLTFKDIDTTQASTHSGVPRSPIIGSTANEVHNEGEVWCVTLWDLRANLITKHGYAVGNPLALQLVTDGMKLSPVNPNFLQARDAIIQADLVNNSGANQNELWSAFAKRGMGASASSPSSSSTTGVVESYDTPDSLSATPLAALTATGQVGGSITPGSQVFTLRNNGTSTIIWSGTKTQSWLSLSSTSGSLSPGATALVTASFNANASSLSAGSYTDTLTFTNTTSGATLIRSVYLTVEPFYNTIFSENFESGSLSSAWAVTGTATHRTLVTTANSPHAGSYQLTMDSSTDLTYARNEATLTLDLSGRRHLVLNFWVKMYDDDANAPATNPFTTGADFDGIAVSNNGGVTWYEIRDLRTITNLWQKISVDLDAALAPWGLAYTSNFKIRFNHYDNYTIPTDGFAFDDIMVAEAFDKSLTITSADSATEGGAPVTATLSVTPVPTASLTVNLASSSPDATVPASVTIAAGSSSVNFDIVPVDDSQLDGSQSATITATAATFPNGSKTFVVHDNETAALALDLPDNLIEGSSPPTGLVSVSAPVDRAVTVELVSDSPSVQPPATVTIPAGATSAQFSLVLVNDNQINGNRPVLVSASVAGWTPGTDTMTILDDETPLLTLTLPTLREGDTGKTGTARISGTLTANLTVSLTGSDNTELTIPASVTILAGQTTATIPLTVVDDTEPDGAQPVTLSGSAAGFPDASVTGSVQDNDAHHFSIASISGPVLRNAQVGVAVTAKDVNDAVITNFSQTLAFSATSGASVNIPVTPASAGNFVNGVLAVNLAFSEFGTDVVLTAADGGGHAGTSNPFDVITGALDHFIWSTIASPQHVDAPFPVTLRAADAAGNPVTTFNGTAGLSTAPQATVEILSWTAYADVSVGGEYANTKQAISTYFTNYHETTTTTTSAATLATLLAGKQVFLIVEQELGSSATLGAIGTSWTTVLNDFVNAGGTVIACSNTSYEHLLLSNSGLLALTPVSSYTSNLVTKTVDTPLNANVAIPFSGAYLHTYTTTQGTVDLQLQSAVNEAVVISRNIGAGRVVMIGSDFFTIGTGMDRVIANAVALTTEASSISLPVTPATTGAFTGGEWTGDVSIPFTASMLRLRATAGTRSADSNTFAVVADQLTPGTIFTENFESGSLNPAFWTSTGTGAFRTQVTTSYTPHGGANHMAMDTTSGAARNEATLTVNLAGQSGVVLKFWAAGYNDEANGPPTSPFTGGADFDGVAISADGITWWEVQGLRSLPSTYGQFSVDLDAAIASRGINYSPSFRIRFNQYDDNPLTTDGIVIDDIAVTSTVPPSALTLSLPAQVAEGAATVHGSVNLKDPAPADLVVTLASKSSSKISVPSSVTIPAGMIAADVPLNVLDDPFVDGTKTVVVTANAPGQTETLASVRVIDNDGGVITLSLPATAMENAGSVTGTVALSVPTLAPLAIPLASDVPLVAKPPATVTVPAGATSATFTITIPDDGAVDGDQTAHLTASTPGWVSATADILVQDNENRNLTLSVPSVLRENDGPKIGTVSLSGTTPTNVTISLASSDSTEVTVPATVTVTAGQSSATFVVSVQDDTQSDGTQPFTISANAPTFTTGVAGGTVRDNDAHHFTFAPFGGQQLRNGPIPAIITARNASGGVVTDCSALLSLTAYSDYGPLTVTPASGGGFINGVWSGSVQIDALATNVILTADDGAGHTGSSLPFELVTGSIDRFVWNTIPASQTLDTPFAASIRAVNAAGTTVAGYNGIANLVVLAPSQNPVIGNAGSSTSNVLYTYYQDFRSDTIYTAAELGGATRITALSLNVTSLAAAGQPLTNFTLRLKHTALPNVSTITSWDNTGWTTVYRASPTISATGWVTFTFTTPFDYNGTQNLMLDISADRTTTNSNYTYLQSTYVGTASTLYGYSNSTNGDPLTWSATTPSVYTAYDRPDIRFSVIKEIPIRPDRSDAFVNGVWNGMVSVPLTGTGLSLRARAGTITGASGSFNVASPPTQPSGGATVFSEDFESGSLNPTFWTSTGTGSFRTQVTSSYTPHGGTKHMTMDTVSGAARNEATLTVNLAGRTGVVLSFWAAGYSDEPTGPPTSPFTGGADFDGLAISANGTTWWEVQGLRSLPSTYGQFTVNLDTAIAALGITYNSTFKIRFNQYDDTSLTSDGIVIDDILVTANPVSGFNLTGPTQITEGDAPVNATVTLDGPAAADTVIALASTAPAKISVPPSITVPAGQTTASFPLTATDDNLVDGNRTVAVSGNISGSLPRSLSVLVLDNDTLPFTLSAPNLVAEGATGQTGKITLAAAASTPLSVSLSSSDTSELTVPAGIEFQPGQTIANFPITVVNDTLIDGTQTATIAARIPGWIEENVTIQVTDNETRALTNSGPYSLNEGGSTNGTVYLTGTLPNDVIISLVSSNPARLTVPASVTIPAGQTSVGYTVIAAENTSTDGTQTVGITASAATFSPATSFTLIYDNDIHHFGFSTVSASQQSGVAFSVTITAQDINNTTISTYSGQASLTASGDHGPVAITPSTVSLTSGSCYGSITCLSADSNVTLSAKNGSTTGTSNAFQIQQGPSIAVTPASISLTLNQGGTATRTIGITNTGGGTLNWTLPTATAFVPSSTSGEIPNTLLPETGRDLETDGESAAPPTLAQVLANLNFSGPGITGMIPNRFNFTEGVVGAYINDGGNDMYDTGNYINTNLGTSIPYSDNTILANAVLGSGGQYFTRKLDGLWIFAADVSSLTYFEMVGGLGADGLGATDSTILTTVRNGTTYRGFVKRVYNASVPSVNHLVILSGGGAATQDASTDTNNDYHRVTGLTGVTRIYDLVYAGIGGAYIDNTATLNLMSAFLDAIETPAWFSAATTSGSLIAGGSQNVAITISSSGMSPGVYNRTLFVGSNDPVTPQAGIPVTLTITNNGKLGVTPATLFTASGPRGGSFTPVSRDFVLTNSGGLALDWTVTATASWISPSPASGTLAPGASVTVTAGINPEASTLASGTRNCVLNFTNTTDGLGNTSRPVALTIVPAGEMAVDPIDTFESICAQGGAASPPNRIYTITNPGDAPINWTAGRGSSWLGLSETSGTLAAGGSKTVTATINGTLLAPGRYNDGITFTNTSNSRGNTQRTVSLAVTPAAPMIAAEPPFTPGTTNMIFWSASPSAGSYEVEESASADFSTGITRSITTGTSRAFPGLLDGTTHHFRVRAVMDNVAGPLTGPWSAVVASTQDASPPAFIRNTPRSTTNPILIPRGYAVDSGAGVASVTVNGWSTGMSPGAMAWSGKPILLVPGSNIITVSASDALTPANTHTEQWIVTYTGAATTDADGDGLPDDWEIAHGFDPAAAGDGNAPDGPNGDPDHDSVANLLEYAFGLDPHAPDAAGLPRASVQMDPSDGKHYLTYQYRRLIQSTGIHYLVETTGDMNASWQSAGSSLVEISIQPTGDGITELHTVRIEPSIDSAVRNFVRLRISTD